MAEQTRGQHQHQEEPPAQDVDAAVSAPEKPTPEQDAARAAELREQLSKAEQPDNARALAQELAAAEARQREAEEAARAAHARAGLVTAGVIPADQGPVGPLPPRDADAMPASASWSQSSSYVIGERDIMAFRAGMAVKSYTMRSASISADGNGRKIVREGTTLSVHVASGMVEPRVAGLFAGILLHRTEVTDGDKDVAILVGGHVKKRYITDNGTFGIPGDPAAALTTGEAGRAMFYHSNI